MLRSTAPGPLWASPATNRWQQRGFPRVIWPRRNPCSTIKTIIIRITGRGCRARPIADAGRLGQEEKTMTGTRNANICEDYATKDVKELGRIYGLSERRILQVLNDGATAIRARTRSTDRPPISQRHAKIGLALYDHRTDNGIELIDMANDLGWSSIKLRKVEKGQAPLELLDLQCISSYIGMRMMTMIEG